MSDEFKSAICDLRHSVALHLQIVGDATVDLAAITVNLLDIIGDDEDRAISKMRELARWLVRRLCEAVIKQARINGCDIRHVENKYDRNCTKHELLCLLANCLRAMRREDTMAIEIYDIDGVLL